MLQLELAARGLARGTAFDALFRSVMDFARPPHPAGVPPVALVPLERSGSTGVVVLITPTHVLCANAGDARAMLARRPGEDDAAAAATAAAQAGGVLPLSFDHKPGNDVELCRVERDGGVVRSGRVDGDLAVSRVLGDFAYKRVADVARAAARAPPGGHSNRGGAARPAPSPPGPSRGRDHRVVARPDFLAHPRAPDRDEFVVLACDGIWDRLTNGDCASLVRTLVRDEGEADAGLIAEEVIDTALELDSRDNMTCVVVLFPPGQAAAPATGSPRRGPGHGGVARRRRERERAWALDDSQSTAAKRAQGRLEARRRRKEQEARRHVSPPRSRPGGAKCRPSSGTAPRRAARDLAATPPSRPPLLVT